MESITARRLCKLLKSSQTKSDILEEFPHLKQHHDELIANFLQSGDVATCGGEFEFGQAETAIFDEAIQLKKQKELEVALAKTRAAHQ